MVELVAASAAEGLEEGMDYVAWLSLVITVIALAFAVQAMRANTAAMRQANKIKEQENEIKSKEIQIKAQEISLRYTYDRRTKLRMKLVWLSRFVHNNIEWSQLQIDEDNHPYKLSDFQWGFVKKCPGDKFCYTILHELLWLHNEMQVLFPAVAEKYRQYCDLSREAYVAHVDPRKTALEETDKMAEAERLWTEIINTDMPRVMRDDVERGLSSGLTMNALEVAEKEQQV